MTLLVYLYVAALLGTYCAIDARRIDPFVSKRALLSVYLGSLAWPLIGPMMLWAFIKRNRRP